MKIKNNKWLTYLLSVGIFLILFEVFSLAIFKLGLIEQGVFRGVPPMSRESFNNYLDERDVDLGWPTLKALAERHEGNGFRKIPVSDLVADNRPPCLGVYGDSFAFGEEVSDQEAWPNQLSKILGCRVLNYGVSGFGTDQALLRFEKLHPDGVPALMTFVSDDLLRNRTQVRRLVTGVISPWVSKPRFIVRNINNTGLELIKLPINNYSELELLSHADKMQSILKYEDFLPDSSAWSSVSDSFPYVITSAKLARNIFVQRVSGYRDIEGKGGLIRLLAAEVRKILPLKMGMDNISIELQLLILERFLRGCIERGISCAILQLPNLMEIQLNKSYQKFLSEPQISELIGKHVMDLDIQCMVDEFAELKIRKNEISNQIMPGKHYNAKSSQVIATCISKSKRLPAKLH